MALQRKNVYARFDLRFVAYAIATACLTGRPAFTSAFTFCLNAAFEPDLFRGIWIKNYSDNRFIVPPFLKMAMGVFSGDRRPRAFSSTNLFLTEEEGYLFL